jgi:hypothetical protein
MLIIAIEDIDPLDEGCIKLAEMARVVGIMDMRQAYLIIEPYMDADKQTAMFMVTQENYLEVAKLFLAMAIFNHACVVHEHFEILAMETDMVRKFSRQYTIEESQQSVTNYLDKFLFLIMKYGG